MDSQWIKSLILLSLDSIENPTVADRYMAICRWYSKNFNTELHITHTLDPEFVIRTYWEDYIGELYEKAEMGDEKSELAYEEFVSNLVKDSSEIKSDVEEEDALMEEMRLQLEKEKSERLKISNKNKDSEQKFETATTSEEPNLIEEENISIPSEDDIVFDEE